MSNIALSMSKVRWLETGAGNWLVLENKARPCVPMHQVVMIPSYCFVMKCFWYNYFIISADHTCILNKNFFIFT